MLQPESTPLETNIVETIHEKKLQSVGMTENMIESKLTCDWSSMSSQVQQIVKHMVCALGDIPCMITSVIDHAYQVIIMLKVNDRESRISVYYNGKEKISRVNYIDSISNQTVVDRLATLIGKSTIAQEDPVAIHRMATMETADRETIEIQGASLEESSVVDTFSYPPEYEYFLKEYMQRIEEKLGPTQIHIAGIESMQYCLRVTFTRAHQSAILNIFYNGKGLITNILPHVPGCKDSAFRDEVTVCIVR